MNLLEKSLNLLRSYIYDREIWSIGIYEGSNATDIYENRNIKNPVLTAKDVKDAKANFVADPFIIKVDNIWYMFFEIFDYIKRKGIIGVATSEDGLTWEYKKTVLEEAFHISYPYVFEYCGKYYMIPETSESKYIKLYEAIEFPYKWKCISNIMEGKYLDPSIFRYNDNWWIFTSKNNNLHLFYSRNIIDGWKEHKMSPIIKSNAKTSRPGGRVIFDNGKMIRYSQDCSESYGKLVTAFEIIRLDEDMYEEKEVKTIIKNSNVNNTWNQIGMHTVDLHIYDNKYIAAVDGKYKLKDNLMISLFTKIRFKLYELTNDKG